MFKNRIVKLNLYLIIFNLRILIDHKEFKALCRKFCRSEIIEKDLDDGEDIVCRNPVQIIKEHGYKVFETVQMALDCLEDFQSVAQGFKDIGYTLYSYDARIEHVEILMDALLCTIQSVLRDDFSEKCKTIWIKILNMIAMEIKIGMSNAENNKLWRTLPADVAASKAIFCTIVVVVFRCLK